MIRDTLAGAAQLVIGVGMFVVLAWGAGWIVHAIAPPLER